MPEQLLDYVFTFIRACKWLSGQLSVSLDISWLVGYRTRTLEDYS